MSDLQRGLDRRTILEAGLALALADFVPLISDAVAAQSNSTDIAALAYGNRIANKKPTTAAREIIQLVQINQGLNNGESPSEIRERLVRSGPVDPQTFREMDSMLNTAPSPEADQWAQYIGEGFRAAGTIAPLFGPGAQIALAVAGEVAEPTLKYLAQSNLILSESPIPQPDKSAREVVSAWVVSRIADKMAKNPAAAAEVIALTKNAGVDLSPRGKRLVIEALPTDARSIAQSNESSSAATKAKIQKHYTHGLQAYMAVTKKGREASPTKAPALTEKEEIDKEEANYHDVVTIGTFVLGRVLGDPAAAKVFSTFATAGGQVAFAFARYPGMISALGLAGAIVGAASLLSSLFAPDAFAEAIKEIKAQLKEIETTLARLEMQNQEILFKLTQVLELVAHTREEILNQGTDILEKLQVLRQEQFRTNRGNQLVTFKNNCVQMSVYLADKERGDNWRSNYLITLLAFFGLASASSQSESFAGLALSEDGPRAIGDKIQVQGRVDLAVSLLPAACEALDIPRKLPLGNYCNPIVWALGTQAFLEAAWLGTKTTDPDLHLENQLNELWAQGAQTRDAIIVCSGPEVIRGAASAYQRLVPDVVAFLVSEAVAHINLKPAVFPGQIPYNRGNPVGAYFDSNRNFWIVGDQHDQVQSVREISARAPLVNSQNADNPNNTRYYLDPDPFVTAKNDGLILKEPVLPGAGSGEFMSTVYRVLINVGPDKGKELWPGYFQFDVVRYNAANWAWIKKDEYENQPRAAHGYGYWWLTHYDFDQPFKKCEQLLRAYGNLNQAKTELTKALMASISGDKDPLKHFFAIASCAQLVAATAKWRATPRTLVLPQQNFNRNQWDTDFERIVSSNLRIVPCISTAQILSAAVDRAVNSYTPEVAKNLLIQTHLEQSLTQMLDASMKAIQAAGDGVPHGVSAPMLDDGLRRIAAYFVAQRIRQPKRV